MRVAVIGGGAVGVTAAYDLAAAGEDVTLLERDAIGAGSTGRAAGIVYDVYADRRDVAIADRAMDRFRSLPVDFEPVPYVWFARDGDDRLIGRLAEQVDRLRSRGRDVSLVDPGELARRYPAMRTDDVAVAAVARDAGAVDPTGYARTVADLARDAGAEIRTGIEARLRPDGTVAGLGRFDAVLVAAGAHTRRVLAGVGVEIAMKPYRVQALRTRTGAEAPTLYDASDRVYLRPIDGGFVVGDGTELVEQDPDAWEREADEAFRSTAIEWLAERFPDVDPRVDEAWAGLCTATPDGDPLVGGVGDGLFVATGFQGHGFMRAPALGEAIAAEIRGEEGIESFAPGRFDADRLDDFEIAEGMAID